MNTKEVSEKIEKARDKIAKEKGFDVISDKCANPDECSVCLLTQALAELKQPEQTELKEQSCENCEHKNDSSVEYCGACEEGRSNWSEAGWHIKERLQAIIDRQAEERKKLLTHNAVLAKSALKAEAENKQQAEEIKTDQKEIERLQSLVNQLCEERESLKEGE